MAKRLAGMTVEVAPSYSIFSIRPLRQSKITSTTTIKAPAAKINKVTQARSSKEGGGEEAILQNHQMSPQMSSKYISSRGEMRDLLHPTLKPRPEVNQIGENCNDNKSTLSTTMLPLARRRIIIEEFSTPTNTIAPMNGVPEQLRTHDWSRGLGSGKSRHELTGSGGFPHLRHKMSLTEIIEK